MKSLFIILGSIVVIMLVLFIFSCMNISGKCSRAEELREQGKHVDELSDM